MTVIFIVNLFSEPLATRVGSSTFCFQRSGSTKDVSWFHEGRRAAAPGYHATSTPLSAMAAGWVYLMTRTANGTSPLDAEAVDGEWSKSHGRHLGTPAPSQRLSHGTNDAEPASKSAEQTLWPGIASTLQHLHPYWQRLRKPPRRREEGSLCTNSRAGMAFTSRMFGLCTVVDRYPFNSVNISETTSSGHEISVLVGEVRDLILESLKGCACKP